MEVSISVSFERRFKSPKVTKERPAVELKLEPIEVISPPAKISIPWPPISVSMRSIVSKAEMESAPAPAAIAPALEWMEV